jgi:hypothetical protein
MCLVLPRLIEGKRYRDLVAPVEFKKPSATQADYNSLVAGIESDMLRLANEYAATREARQWFESMYNLLYAGHTQAAGIGRRLAGGHGPSMFDQSLGRGAADLQAAYLQNYLDDLEAGRYDGEDGLDTDAMQVRNRLYASQTRGTANEAFVGAHGEEEVIQWVMTAVELHCLDCPVWAADGPYTRETLSIFPGDGSTQCLGNCLCVLRTPRGTGVARAY